MFVGFFLFYYFPTTILDDVEKHYKLGWVGWMGFGVCDGYDGAEGGGAELYVHFTYLIHEFESMFVKTRDNAYFFTRPPSPGDEG